LSVLWPAAPHRVLRSAIAAAEERTEDIVGEDRVGEQLLPIQRFSVIAPTTTTRGAIDAMALYAGEGVACVNSVQPAATIIAELVEGAERLLDAAKSITT
jgi:hypothetical protein